MAVQKVMAQIIVLLGHYGTVTGKRGRDLVEFIIKLCAAIVKLEVHTALGPWLLRAWEKCAATFSSC